MSAVETPASSELTRDELLEAYRVMRTIREFEERVHLEFATGEIPGSGTFTRWRRRSPLASVCCCAMTIMLRVLTVDMATRSLRVVMSRG